MAALTRFGMFPPVIKTIVIVNVAVYLFQILFLRGFSIGTISLEEIFVRFLYLHPVESDSFYIWQLISYQFLHDPSSIFHIFFNLFALWMFGVELEQMWGGPKFLTFYLLAGIGAGLTQLFISPLFSTPGLTIGASGSVYGILLAFGLTFPDRPIFMFPFFIPIPAKFFVLIYAGISLLLGITSDGNIAHFAHLGGAATGYLLFKFGDKLGLYEFVMKLFKKKQSYINNDDYHQKVYRMDQQSRQYSNQPSLSVSSNSSGSGDLVVDNEFVTQETINKILDKISETGYQNLSDKERKILFELSKKLK